MCGAPDRDGDLQALEKRVWAERRKKSEQIERTWLKLFERMGHMVWHLKATPGALDLYVGQFVDDESIPDFVAHLIGDIATVDDLERQRWRGSDEHHEQRLKLSNELQEIRNKTLLESSKK